MAEVQSVKVKALNHLVLVGKSFILVHRLRVLLMLSCFSRSVG